MRFATVAIGMALLVLSGCAGWRISQAAELARLSQPFQQTPAQPAVRLLIVGDSTAVGTGASSPANSLAGLLAQGRPNLLIENRAEDGAKFADVVRQLSRPGRFDVVLVQAGGNDVIRLTGQDELAAGVRNVVQLAQERASHVVLMPAGNVGNAPFFWPPWSWWMSQRARELHRLVKEAAAAGGATYVNLYREPESDQFAHRPELHARDGLHPSDAGYRVWREELLAQSDLGKRLGGAAMQTAPTTP